MSWHDVAYPAGWVTVSSGRHCNLFLQGATLAFTLSASTAVSYEVRDYHGTVVASGSVSGTSLTLAALPLGWYRLYLYQSGSDANYGSLIGASMFSVLRSEAHILDPPAAGVTVGIGPAYAGADEVVRGISLLGPFRHSIQYAENPTNGNIENNNISTAVAEQGYIDTWYGANPDSARPRPSFIQFPNGTNATPAHIAGVTQVVSSLYPVGIHYFEGPQNEPDLRNLAWVSAMQTFYNAVKAGNPAAKALGPGQITVNGTVVGAPALEGFLAAGGGAYMDAFSFHAYNVVNGDIVLGRRSMTELRRVLTDHGLGNIEMWQTEWGQFATTYGVFTPARQARWAMMNRFVLEQFGIPKERDSWFYDTSHGFWNFPSMWKLADGTVTPMIPMMRVYSQEVWGKAWDSALDFGTVENDHYIGNRFENPSDGSAVLAFLSGGRTDGTVSLSVTGASSVEIVGPFGDVTTSTVTGGLVNVAVTCDPVYVRLPAGVTATVEAVDYGLNVAGLGTLITGQGTVGQTELRKVADDVKQTYYFASNTAETEFRDDATLPATLTVELRDAGQHAVESAQIDTVVVECMTPWQSQATLLDFDVEYQDTSGSWHVLETITEPSVTIDKPNNYTQTACKYETYHSGRCIFVSRFDAVIAKAVRLTVRDASYGGEMTADAVAFGGQGDGTRRISIRELGVYSSNFYSRHVPVLASSV